MKRYLGRLDWYIIKKFIGTYFFAIFLILSIAIVFDVNEKLDYFLKPNCTIYDIIFHYYINFIPFYANLFSPLFVFISVIFFTSKLTEHNEIISILASGVSFKRLLRPYMIAATIIAILSFVLNNFVIPPGNKIRLKFEDTYISNKIAKYAQSVQIEVKKGELLFISSFDRQSQTANDIALEKYNGRELVSRLTADQAVYTSPYHWSMSNFRIRNFTKLTEKDSIGNKLDTIIPVKPSDFLISANDVETLTTPQLIKVVKRLKTRGVGNSKLFQMEEYKRLSSIFSAFILTFIGVVLSSKKKKNGMGINIAIGISLCFGYIFFMTVSSTFAISGDMPIILAAWLPNILFTLIALALWSQAPK